MIRFIGSEKILSGDITVLNIDSANKVIIFERCGFVFVFNFNHEKSFENYRFAVKAGKYIVVLDSDAVIYGGSGRNDDSVEHFTIKEANENKLSLYLPSRSALVLKNED